ncbi:hypothetical protein HN51_028437 [Arachis hypogaea]
MGLHTTQLSSSRGSTCAKEGEGTSPSVGVLCRVDEDRRHGLDLCASVPLLLMYTEADIQIWNLPL